MAPTILETLGAIFIVLLPFLIYGILNPDKVEKWAALLSRLFTWTGQRMQKKYIALDIQGQINSFSRRLNNQAHGSMPYPVSLKWVRETDKATFIMNNEVVVRMALHTNQDINCNRDIPSSLSFN